MGKWGSRQVEESGAGAVSAVELAMRNGKDGGTVVRARNVLISY